MSDHDAMEPSPAEIVQALLRPGAYPHPADDLQLRETHGAWVILAGEFAYKLKKPVNFGFFDFSTVEKRNADAEAEVRLNRRLAPSTYLGVAEVVEREGQVFVGGSGRVLERAVKMRRLPEEGMLTSLLVRGEVTPRLVRRIARIMARFHQTVATGPGVDDYGRFANAQANWRENFEQIKPYVGLTITAQELSAIERFVGRELREDHELLDRRVATGRIRDGHGDLHAGSICVQNGKIVIFDCIQFSPRYRCADVAAEVAFLSMDLDHSSRADLGWAFVDEYVRRSDDLELPRLLGLYKCYRAFVRGKVLSLRLGQGNISGDQRAALVAQARSYFDLATTYARVFRPQLVVVSGLPASGKTTLAKTLAGRLGLVHISTDVVRKRRARIRPTDRASAGFEEGLYEPRSTEATYRALRRDAATWLGRGLSVVLDGTFSTPRQRQLARKLALRWGADFRLVVTECDDATARRRFEERSADPTNVSDATWEIYQRLRESYVPPDDIPPAELLVDRTGGQVAQDVVDHLLRGRSGAKGPNG